MYICKSCGRLEEEPRIIRERHGFTWGPYEQVLDSCFCGGEFDGAEICKECGEYVAEGTLSLSDDGRWICEECYNEHEEAKAAPKIDVRRFLRIIPTSRKQIQYR